MWSAGKPKLCNKNGRLAEERLLPDEPPFTSIRVDYFGPFDGKQDSNTVKRYGLLFTCPTRAAHIEIVHRSVRKVLRSILTGQSVNDEFLLCEVESIPSDKPLTTATDDPADTEPLIPNHLLLMKKPTVLPPGLTKRGDSYTRRQWKQLQYLGVLFSKWCVREYLPMLQEQQKWSWIKKNVS